MVGVMKFTGLGLKINEGVTLRLEPDYTGQSSDHFLCRCQIEKFARRIQEQLLVLDGTMDTLKHDMQHGFDMLSGSPIRIHAAFEGHAGSLIIQHANDIKNLDIHCAPLSINHYVTDDNEPRAHKHPIVRL
jgi:hypothetical protein